MNKPTGKNENDSKVPKSGVKAEVKKNLKEVKKN